ncbi:MFS transporter [Acuticoccus sediminis]|uniref:MFS transporter n=2 Tax=Acuticoccus sediminis TaxID=2184697 RepID=A0A8B2NV54_9HYPH|nr:MFS transporter [Acuticoccus sediminis]
MPGSRGGPTAGEPTNEPPMTLSQRRTLALVVTGFGAMLNLYAPQPVLPLLRDAFGVSAAVAATTVTATALAVALVGPFAGAASDAWGRRPVILVALAGVALPTLLCAFADSISMLIVLRFAQGLFIPAAFAAALAYASEEWPPGQRGRATTYYISSNIVGGFIGRVIGGVAAEFGDWHMAFLVLGAANVVCAVVVALTLPASRQSATDTRLGRAIAQMPRHLADPMLLSAFVVGFCILFAMVTAFTYVNFHLAEPPWSLGPGALSWLFCSYLVGVILLAVSGRLIDTLGPRIAVMIAAGIAVIGGLCLLATPLWVIALGLVLLCLGTFVCQSATTRFVGANAVEGRSAAAGLYLAFYYGGGALGAVLPGFAFQRWGWTSSVAIMLCAEFLIITIAAIAWRRAEGRPAVAT